MLRNISFHISDDFTQPQLIFSFQQRHELDLDVWRGSPSPEDDAKCVKKGSVKLRPVMRRQDTLTTREILKVNLFS